MNEIWTWWCQEDLFGKHPKKTICLHVQRGREEFEARHDIALDYYRDNIRHVELPKRKRDIIDVLYPETMETWPRVMRFVMALQDYVYEKHGLHQVIEPTDEEMEHLHDALKHARLLDL